MPFNLNIFTFLIITRGSLDDAHLFLDREFLVKGHNEELVKAYYSYMVDVAVIYGSNRDAALKELKETLDFEIELAKICAPKEERRNATALYNLMTVEKLQLTYPNTNWRVYLNNVLHVTSITISYNDPIIVSSRKYITDLEGLLKRTPKRVQANYLLRRAAMEYIFYLTEELRDRQLGYETILVGQKERQSRWKECTNLAIRSIHLASGSLYIKKYFNENAKSYAEEIVNDIRSQFDNNLENIEWMDDETKMNALEKSSAIYSFVGYPSELLDDDEIENYYEKLEPISESYLKSVISLKMFNTERTYEKLREVVNKTYWADHAYPTTVNAFYSASENSIQFPAGILQGIFFSDDRPRYMNYARIGYVIGHEITHGFDDEGRQYDKNGNLNDWWAEDTKDAFIEKAQCIIEQYENYTVDEINENLNGINTQGENIADNGGIKVAYLAYQDWVARNEPEQRLPGLDYTLNQMFWISAAQTWCIKQRKEILKLKVATGYHSPGRFRVLGPFGNSEYFSQDFNCPLGSKMNPEYKCEVW